MDLRVVDPCQFMTIYTCVSGVTALHCRKMGREIQIPLKVWEQIQYAIAMLVLSRELLKPKSKLGSIILKVILRLSENLPLSLTNVNSSTS